MPASQNQGADRQQQRLKPEDRSMNKSHRVDGVECKPVNRAEILSLQRVVIAGVGIGDAVAARRKPVKLPSDEGYKVGGDGAGLSRLHRIDQLVRRSDLP